MKYLILTFVLIMLLLISTGCTLKPKHDPESLLDHDAFSNCKNISLKATAKATSISCNNK